MGLGPWPEVSLAQARRALGRRGGADPRRPRSDLGTPAPSRRRAGGDAAHRPDAGGDGGETFDAKRNGLRGDGDQGRWLSPLTTHVLPKLGKRRISTVTLGRPARRAQTDLGHQAGDGRGPCNGCGWSSSGRASRDRRRSADRGSSGAPLLGPLRRRITISRRRPGRRFRRSGGGSITTDRRRPVCAGSF